MKIAVIGSGVSGAALSFLLSEAHHEVTVFEREAHIGMDAHSVNIDGLRVDVPPRHISPLYYPNLCAIYARAGIKLEPWVQAYSVSISLCQTPCHQKSKVDDDRDNVINEDDCPMSNTRGIDTSTLFHISPSRPFGYRLPSFGSHISQWFKPKTYRIMYDAVRFFRSVERDVLDPKFSHFTLKQYLDERECGDEFVFGILMPLLSMICTCSYAALFEYPVDILLQYLIVINTPASQLRVKYGCIDAGTKLLRNVTKTHFNTAVTGVWHGDDDCLPRLSYTGDEGFEVIEEFDHIVFATQPDAVLNLLSDATELEKQALGMFEVEDTTVSVHQDTRFMPSQSEWGTVNIFVDAGEDDDDVNSSDTATSMFSIDVSTTSLYAPEAQGMKDYSTSGNGCFLTW